MISQDQKPNTQYTKSGRINIAYQVYGSGPVDLVYIPGWVSNIDWMWACPELVYFFTELGKVCRIILFDKRGTGLSDRIVESSTMEERMDDIRAVMDAVGSEKAFLFGHSEGGSVSALFAATYPNRTIGLLTFGIFAKRRYSEAYPWAPTDEERGEVYDMIDQSWGSGDMNLASLAPSKGNDKAFMSWLANYFRSGASPSAAMVLTRMNTEVDIIHVLSSIRVPCLILQRTNDIDVKIEEGRFIADRIPGARFVELPGNDHLFWIGDADRVLKEMKTFIHRTNPIDHYEDRLFTFVAGEISAASSSESVLQIRDIISQYRGTIIHENAFRFLATFDGPS
ncbi:MAG: alpha/beta hydrolase, partial [Bacteroidota bacterium]